MAGRTPLPISTPVVELERQKNQITNNFEDQDHYTLAFLNGILIAALGIKYQNMKGSPFEDHKVHMQIYLTSICIYCMLVVGIKINTKTPGGNREQILSFALLLFGVLPPASLVSILLLQQIFWVVLFVGGSVLIILARHTLKISACWIINVMVVKISTMFSSIFKTKDSADGSNDTTYPNPADLV